MNKRIFLILLLAATYLMPFSAMAGESDKPKQVTCAAIKIFECTSTNGCEEVTAESIDLPQMFRIDFTAKTVTGIINGKERVTPIEALEYIDGKLMLYGAQDGTKTRKDGVAWNAVIDETTGDLVVSVASENVAFSIFGACIPR